MGKGITWEGKKLAGVNRGFLDKVTAAALAQGATKIFVFSGRRSKATNTGVSNSNHLYGHAIDAKAFVPGTGWVLLGTLIAPVAGKFGLRSGDQKGFYKGQPDPEHVDDGFNVNHGKPLPTDYNATPIEGQPAPPAPEPAPAPAGPSAAAPTVTAPAENENIAMPGTQDFRLQDWASIASDPLASPETKRLAGLIGG